MAAGGAIRRRIEVFGIVQGVGFRPAVFRMAGHRGLTGTIANTAAGIAIEIQGPEAPVEDFIARLPVEAPALARITATRVSEMPSAREEGFRILPSRDEGPRHALVLPDVAVCEDCRRELFDPADRRYRYPFINCTNCGPRYTIMRDIPYDRPRTSMAGFPMCDACREEYEDPADRRFHAQATCCPDCGPRLDAPLADAVRRLHAGEVVALKGIGGFHLAVDATNANAVARLRERKRRVEKPFAVMVPDLDRAERFCFLGEEERRLLRGVEHPIVLVRRRRPGAVAEQVAPGNEDLGLFLPYTPLHHLLFDEGGFDALVMTSGNRSEEPIAIGNDEALARLRGLADAFVSHDREILTRCDDSVVRVVGGRVRQLRMSRGYVPVPLVLRAPVPPILAVGGELKNTICLTKGACAFLSQHVGDLENFETTSFFEETVAHLQHILGVSPDLVAHDLHPDSFGTRWALRGPRRIAVQHHHAHVASCMAEHGLDGRVIGVALDGTGYGTDGAIWGGEVLVADYAGFERVAHLAYVPLPGGDAAIREPWRMAVSHLVRHLGTDAAAPFRPRIDAARYGIVRRMVERGIHAPPTSSCGRLFDAVAALIGLRLEVSYEAQAAVELEMVTRAVEDGGAYAFSLPDLRPLFEGLLVDIGRGVPPGVLGRRFHNGLVAALADACLRARADHGLGRVCLSGGTFQNTILATELPRRLEAEGFEVFLHARVPANDGGLSLGQALVAAHAR